MSRLPFYTVIYLLAIVLLVVALPAGLLFFWRKSSPRPPRPWRASPLPAELPAGGTDLPASAEGVRSGEARLSSWNELFGRALGLYRQRFLSLAPLGLASSILTCIVFGFLWFLASLRMEGESYAEIFSSGAADPLTLGLSVVGAAAFLLLMLWGQLAFLYAHVGERPGGEVLLQALQRLGPYVGLCLLYLAIMTVGGLFLIVPGVLLALWHVLAPAVFVAENESPLGALRQSRSYLRGRLPEVFPRIFALACFAVVALYSSLLFAIPQATREAPLPVLVPLMALPLVLYGHFACTCLFVLYQELKATPAAPPGAVPAAGIPPAGAVPSAGELSRSAWAAFGRRAPTLAALQLGIYAMAVLAYVVHTRITDLLDRFVPDIPEWGLGGWVYLPRILLIVAVLFGLYLVIWGAFYVGTLYVGLALTFAVADETRGIGDALRLARQRLAPYALISFWRDLLIAAGSILYLPGLLFRVKYAFSPFVFALEGERGMNVLAKSSEYAKVSPLVFQKVLAVAFLKSLKGMVNRLVEAASLLVFAPLLVFSGLVLAFFVGIFALLGIPFGLYVELFPVAMLGSIVILAVWFSLFFLPAFLLLYYYRLYQAARTLYRRRQAGGV